MSRHWLRFLPHFLTRYWTQFFESIAGRFISLQLILIAGLAFFSDYRLPDLSQANWDTVLFLTPYGILTNYINRDHSVMWSFYKDTSANIIECSTSTKVFLVVVYLALAASAYFAIQKIRKHK